MNANDLWAGNDYAYTAWRQKGVFPMDCVKVHLLGVRKRREPGNERYTAIARVQYYDNEGNLRPQEREVRARDIIDFWEDYEAERNHRNAERDRIENERQEAIRKESERKTKIQSTFAAKTGLDILDVMVDTLYVKVPIAVAERWLSPSDES